MVRKQVTPTKDPSDVAAERLWDELRTGLFMAQSALVNIIAAKAWQPRHESFAKAWVERMADISIAAELRPHVVYQLIEDGLTEAQIADAVKGVGPAVVADLKRQKEHGVPPEVASAMRKNAKPAKATLPYQTMFVRVPRNQMSTWRKLARRNNTSVEEIAYAATAQAFNDLG